MVNRQQLAETFSQLGEDLHELIRLRSENQKQAIEIGDLRRKLENSINSAEYNRRLDEGKKNG